MCNSKASDEKYFELKNNQFFFKRICSFKKLCYIFSTNCRFRLGFILNGRCQPSMSNNQPASQITWNQIQKNWFYDDLLLGSFKLQNIFNVKRIIFKKYSIRRNQEQPKDSIFKRVATRIF